MKPSHATSAPRADARLGLMMFLHFAVLGVWLPILPSYLKADPSAGGLGFDGYQVGWIIGIAPALAAMASPFIAGQVTDRLFASEHYLSGALLAAGTIHWVLSYQTSFAAWAVLSLLHALCYFPTMGLVNSLAMTHLTDAGRQFGKVRLWGTLGWIAVAWTFPVLFLQRDLSLSPLPPFLTGEDRPDATAQIVYALRASGTIAIGYALFCLLLPHTPPKRDAPERWAFLKASRLLRSRSVLVLVVVSLMVAAIDRIYFLQTAPYLQSIGLATKDIMPAMSIGQFAEIAMMALLGRLLAKLGFRGVLVLGVFCYFLRYAVFGTTALPLAVIVASQFLHGVCFTCSLTTVVIYLDRIAPGDVRHSVQTGLTLVAVGPGAMLGGWLNGFLETVFSSEGTLDYARFWYTCAAIGLLATLIVALLFRDETRPQSPRLPAGDVDRSLMTFIEDESP